MPDEPTTPPAPGNQDPAGQTPAPQQNPPDPKLGPEGEKALDAWKQRARTAEAEAKRTKELEARLKEFEDRDKTETEKLAARAAQAESDAAAARNELLRIKVSSAKGLPPELSERLRGDNEKELGEDADRLLELVKPRGSGGGGFDQGARTPASPGDDMNALLRKAAGRQ